MVFEVYAMKVSAHAELLHAIVMQRLMTKKGPVLSVGRMGSLSEW